jgi:hypothetical protein
MDIRASEAGTFVQGLVPKQGEVIILFILFFYSN